MIASSFVFSSNHFPNSWCSCSNSFNSWSLNSSLKSRFFDGICPSSSSAVSSFLMLHFGSGTYLDRVGSVVKFAAFEPSLCYISNEQLYINKCSAPLQFLSYFFFPYSSYAVSSSFISRTWCARLGWPGSERLLHLW